jgi:hypothetical protein
LAASEHDEVVMMMNEVRHRASGRVQCVTHKVISMIDEPGQSAGTLQIPYPEEMTMLKTISAALLAVSVLAAPAFAATAGKTAQAPVTKSAQLKTDTKTTAKTTVKSGALNANAKMDRHHSSHHRYHRNHHHKKMSALKTQPKTHTKISSKHAVSTIKRG